MKKQRSRLAPPSQAALLLFSAFLVAACGLVYELVAGTVSSYVLGDSVTQFSRTIGVYLFAMGLGSYLSRFIVGSVVEKFIEIEIILALIGGLAAPLLFFAFAITEHYAWLLYSLLVIVGTLVGLEIPLLLRILKDRMQFRDLVARVLSLDYIGGLVAAISFPVFLLRPEIGLIRASLIAGVVNVLVAFTAIGIFRQQIRFYRNLLGACAVALILLTGLFESRALQNFIDNELHVDPVIYSEQSPYQKIVMTSWQDHFSLFLNNNLQFNSFDEYRYHESLVHLPAQIFLANRKDDAAPLRVLVMGGGDGLAVREFLRYPQLKALDLVDIDPAITKLAKEHPWLRTLNRSALSDPRVTVHHEDAFVFIRRVQRPYDVIVLDFPDPGNFAIGKLYSDLFFQRLKQLMSPGAVAVTQATSPFIARTAFWCIDNTIAAQGYYTLPYHVYVPSFGEWGFVAFSLQRLVIPQRLILEKELRFLRAELLASLTYFPADMASLPTGIQTLVSQNLVHYYEREWHKITR